MASPEELLGRLELFGIRLGLENIRQLLARLGDPQSGRAIVLVAGTNGKGSTAALLSAIATVAGYRTGLYTSPHLVSVRERIRVDGRAISEPRLSAALERVLDAGRGESTYFEALTAAALLEFERQQVELAVLEVGLGGRLDATNAAEPVLSLITEIGLDHREHLGATLGEIAVEKAGILRAGIPAAMWVTAPEARRAIERQAAALPTSVHRVDRDCEVGATAGGREIELRSAGRSYRLRPRLLGSHQLANLALAVAGAELLGSHGWQRIDRDAVVEGVGRCRWPGRLEWVDLGEGRRVLLDGAHNPAAAGALSRYLSERAPGYTLVFGALRDKDVGGMLPALADGAARTVLTTAASPRAIPPQELQKLLPGRTAEVVEEPRAALAAALEGSGPVVVCGSLFLVGAIRAELTRAWGVPPATTDDLL